MSGRAQARRRAVSEAERQLWRSAIRDAKPLAGRDVPPPPPPPPPAEPVVADAPPSPAIQPLPVRHGTGLDKRSAERLRRGQMRIDARLDLHGMTQDVAHAALHGFVERAMASGFRVLLVITGKGEPGGGVLKRGVPRWLDDPAIRRFILDTAGAQPKHGGEGALYVLLRRVRP